jgi:hypothetical protein
MPLIATRGAASAQGFGEFAQATAANYVEDVFSTYLYTGNGSTQTITNGINLSGLGGLVWTKSRNNVTDHSLADTNRGAFRLLSNDTTSQLPLGITYNSNGFTMGTSGSQNASGYTYASWTFRKQPKFFDVVTYTGDGVAGRTVAHNLGSVPGCIMVKNISRATDWIVYHRSIGATGALYLNTTTATVTATSFWNNTNPTSTQFTTGTWTGTNYSGDTFVAYLFAHDAGGFGLTGTDNVISCGSVSATGSTLAEVNLGWEPQWVLIKGADITCNWSIIDNMRGFTADKGVSWLFPNSSAAEASTSSLNIPGAYLTSTGFKINANESPNNGTGTYIYIAIRRGPMKVPTTGTSVFTPVTSSAQTGTITSGFPTDLVMELDRTTGQVNFNRMFQDRLRGKFQILDSSTTAAETSNTSTASFDSNTGIILNGGGVYVNGFVYEQFRRAPGFFDEVCYTGTGVGGRTVAHNLTVAPELVIVKARSITEFWGTLYVATSSTGALNGDFQFSTGFNQYYFGNDSIYIAPTSSVFTVGSVNRVNASGATYVAYLFATCPGVSSVGSYTGTAALQTINCGFAAGARFVLIKRIDSSGDWYVWDSARGISSGNDPYLLLNSTAAEVTSTNYVDTTAVGFQVTAAAPAAINANGGTFIFLAVA